MYITTKGLVLRETGYKDSSKILTVLTAAEGKLTVSARGALRKNSKMAAATQLLTFSEMTLFQRGDRWTLTEAQVIETFGGLTGELASLSLGSYFAELLEALSDEDSPNPEILSLGLNALYLLSEGRKPPELVKSAFEARLMCLSGFAPLLGDCAVCGGEVLSEGALDLQGGTLACARCGGRGAALGAGALAALRHICGCAPGRVFSFTLEDMSLAQLASVTERYALTQLDRGFSTLDYYKKIKV